MAKEMVFQAFAEKSVGIRIVFIGGLLFPLKLVRNTKNYHDINQSFRAIY
jgi:hypothetical protein